MKKIKKLFLLLFAAIFISTAFPNLVPITSINYVEAAKVKISKSKATLIKGQTLKLEVKNTSAKIKWTTSNKKIATVNSSGKVTAKSSGTATITAKVGSKQYKCKVKIETPKISNAALEISKGESFKLSMLDNTQKVKWTTSNKSIATVNSNGKVTAKKVGKATITATIGSKKYKCKVTVINKPSIGSRTNPRSAYEPFTSNIYNYSRYLGNFTIQLLEYKSGDEAYKYVKDEYTTEPKSDQEYIYLKFNIKYNYGSDSVSAIDVVNHYSNLFNTNATLQIDNINWEFKDGDLDMVNVEMYPGANVTCSTAILIRKGNTPITYRLETGYDKTNFSTIYTWFKTY